VVSRVSRRQRSSVGHYSLQPDLTVTAEARAYRCIISPFAPSDGRRVGRPAASRDVGRGDRRLRLLSRSLPVREVAASIGVVDPDMGIVETASE
jgi:hypothetical protein